MSGLKHRLTVWKSISLQRTPAILIGIWGFFGTLTTIRDNFLSPAHQQLLATPTVLAQLTWTHYFMFLMVIALVAILEGAFTFVQKYEELLSRTHSAEREVLRQKAAQLEDKLYQQSRQLEMPDIVPELLGVAIGENTTDRLDSFDRVLDTWVRVQLRVKNLNRVAATVTKIELIVLSEPKIRMHSRSDVWLETFKQPVAFGAPLTGLVVFYAPKLLQSSINPWPFVIEVTDGTGNARMTPPQRFRNAGTKG